MARALEILLLPLLLHVSCKPQLLHGLRWSFSLSPPARDRVTVLHSLRSSFGSLTLRGCSASCAGNSACSTIIYSPNTGTCEIAPGMHASAADTKTSNGVVILKQASKETSDVRGTSTAAIAKLSNSTTFPQNSLFDEGEPTAKLSEHQLTSLTLGTPNGNYTHSSPPATTVNMSTSAEDIIVPGSATWSIATTATAKAMTDVFRTFRLSHISADALISVNSTSNYSSRVTPDRSSSIASAATTYKKSSDDALAIAAETFRNGDNSGSVGYTTVTVALDDAMVTLYNTTSITETAEATAVDNQSLVPNTSATFSTMTTNVHDSQLTTAAGTTVDNSVAATSTAAMHFMTTSSFAAPATTAATAYTKAGTPDTVAITTLVTANDAGVTVASPNILISTPGAPAATNIATAAATQATSTTVSVAATTNSAAMTATVATATYAAKTRSTAASIASVAASPMSVGTVVSTAASSTVATTTAAVSPAVTGSIDVPAMSTTNTALSEASSNTAAGSPAGCCKWTGRATFTSSILVPTTDITTAATRTASSTKITEARTTTTASSAATRSAATTETTGTTGRTEIAAILSTATKAATDHDLTAKTTTVAIPVLNILVQPSDAVK